MNLDRLVYIDVKFYLYKVRRKLPWFIVWAALGATVGILIAEFALSQDNIYQAVASVYSLDEGSYENTANGLSVLREYSEYIDSWSLAAKIKENLQDEEITVNEIYDMLSTDERVITGSSYVYENPITVLHIYVEYKDEDECIAVVNNAADIFTEELNKILDGEPLVVLDYAVETEMTYNALLYQTVAVAGGIFLAIFFYAAFLLVILIFSPKLQTVRDVEIFSDLPIMGIIPDSRE